MKKCFVLMLTLIAGIIFSFQAARAQFPKIKTPKLGQPQSTQTDSGQPASSSNTQPAQPQPDNRNTRSTATEAAINKPSIQINLRTHRQYYRNGQRDASVHRPNTRALTAIAIRWTGRGRLKPTLRSAGVMNRCRSYCSNTSSPWLAAIGGA